MSLLKEIFGIILLLALPYVQCQVPFSISLSARELPNYDIVDGRPDPYVHVLVAEGLSEFYNLTGQTIAKSDTNNPIWTEVFNFKFIVGANQRLGFEIWDEDIDSDDYMGRVDMTFAKIVNAENDTTEFEISDCMESSCGQLLITRELTVAN